ncbi:rRNA maturation RNase YbeY [Frankia sp. AgKG'84/4]|uniref:rRNA maturation RNase YbeY n=1 Tax=Frankia sp. AgKG'84/4 TaxID=573490 RepID=UPI002010A2C6|nr:rRNA maturation RNase YbeY [Frankia sp. AgKG'84/4]MCL9793130.1 rRNA maturation RNase YbeY [Frankia sp. AgKG'84/4]
MAVFVANESSAADVNEVRLTGLARFVLDAMKVSPLAELSVMLIEEKAMSDLHVRYMGEEGPTDVLSFAQDEAFDASWSESGDDDPTTLLGDVVLCPDVARRQAEQAGHSFERELHLLCTHGILHLLGYDHAEPDEEREMWKIQSKLLASWEAAARTAGGKRPAGGASGTGGADGASEPGPTAAH